MCPTIQSVTSDLYLKFFYLHISICSAGWHETIRNLFMRLVQEGTHNDTEELFTSACLPYRRKSARQKVCSSSPSASSAHCTPAPRWSLNITEKVRLQKQEHGSSLCLCLNGIHLKHSVWALHSTTRQFTHLHAFKHWWQWPLLQLWFVMFFSVMPPFGEKIFSISTSVWFVVQIKTKTTSIFYLVNLFLWHFVTVHKIVLRQN